MVHATEAKQLSRAASSLLFTGLDFAPKPNGTYPSEDFDRVSTPLPTGKAFCSLLRGLWLPDECL